VAKVLVVENDSVFTAVLEDRLHVSGHEVRRLPDAARAAAAASEQQVDLVVLDLPPGAGLGAVEALRRQATTRTVPILLLSGGATAADRVAALRAGVDDYLTQPCDLDELLLRVDRLLSTRTAGLQVLQGDLADHPLWAVLQYLRQVSKSGHLRVKGPGGSGTLELHLGELAGARWQSLRGREALLALLCVEEGGFRFDADEAAAIAADAAAGELSMHEMLMQAAWLKDEMAKRREHLPATGQPLHALRESLPELDHDLERLPLQRVLTRLLRQPGLRLFDLVADEAEAPLTTRLAVAWLVEHGVLAPEGSGRVLPTTMEISNAIILEIAVADLVEAAERAGLATSALPYLLLVEPAVWPALRRLVEGAPGFKQNEGLARLIEQVELRRAGSVQISSGSHGGKVSLHVQALTGAAQPQISAIVPGCAGVLVWLQGTEALETAAAVVQRLEASSLRGASGVLVGGTKPAHDSVLRLARGTSRWRTSEHAPQSLLGLLRLLHPPESR